MKSVREVTKAYNALMERQPEETTGINCYVCPDNRITKTIHVDAGTTPMMMDCPDCKNTTRSTFYRDIAPNQEPTIEWYRPNLKQTLKLRKNPQMLEHVLLGGLLKRPIK